jgi:Domain of unknown function (DUF1841)
MSLFGGQTREALRRSYVDAWRKHRDGSVMTPLESQLARAIVEHPEYHAWFESESSVGKDFSPEAGQTNPFLHLGMHLALRDQVATDRPAGVQALHAALAVQLGGEHEAEHLMMEALGESLWQAQRSGRAPDERQYLDRLRQLAARRR